MESSRSSAAPPAASANARSSPFAYQTKLLERQGSKASQLSSTFSLSSNDSAGQRAGAGGLQPSPSIRRYNAMHRHTSSLDPLRPTDAAASSSASPASASPAGQPGEFGTSGQTSPTGRMSPERSSNNLATHSLRSSKHMSMPAGPPGSSAQSLLYRSTSPTKSSPFARTTSPTKLSFNDTPGSPVRAPASPPKDAAASNTSPKSPSKEGSFWSGQNASPHPSPAYHLGGVSDLKRSSVGALKIMRDFTTKSGASIGGEGNQARMMVGRSPSTKHSDGRPERVGLGVRDENRGRALDDYESPKRPGRMESEDQAGEIVLPGITTGAEDVAGLHGRIRLARQDGPGTIALGRATATSTLPFSNSSKWMDTQRHLLQAYEYLCHCGEAKQWMEHHVGEDLGAIVDMENGMRDGVFLAKLARTFEPTCVPRIFVHPKLQFRHTDNINHFFRFVKTVSLPDSFQFELTDLYEKKNFPKVVYCIHALSHVLARQGRSLKVGNLVGKLEFSDDQLQKTQRGLDAAGVAMPSFGGLGKNLAREMNVEPEPEPETEQDRIDRELAENIKGVVALQSICRGFLARRRYDKLLAADKERRQRQEERRQALLAEQARQRAEEEARRLAEEEARRKVEEEARRRAEEEARRMAEQEARRRAEEEARRRAEEERRIAEEARRKAEEARRQAEEEKRRQDQERLERMAPGLQAHARGFLLRQRFYRDISALDKHENAVIALQAQARGVLARRALLNRIRQMRSSTGFIIDLQAQARGFLARRQHQSLQNALQRVEVTKSVNTLQTMARAALVRKRHAEQRKKLDFVAPDITGLQAHCRGVLARQEYAWWRDYLHDSEPVVIVLQSLIRGTLARRTFRNKMRHYREHLDKVVKIQSLFRGKQQGEQYRSLTVGKNVPVSTIKNFGHLLNESDHDFEDEIEVEALRKLVVKSIRENQTLDNDVAELDTKIALLVKNKIGIEDLVKAKHERGLLRHLEGNALLERQNSLLSAAGDPFADATLDRSAKKKLELYQELFYSLQTRPEYLARLFASVGKIDMADKQRKHLEKVVLTLFGYAQNAREEYLLLRLFQRCVVEELAYAVNVQDFMRSNPQFIKLVVQYNRGAKERQYLRDLLSPLVRGVMEDEALDLETDPCAIYRATINQEEMETGQPSRRPMEVDFQQALEDPTARVVFIRHLQALRATTDMFLTAVVQSTHRMPYGTRYIAREVFRALQEKFPHESQEALLKVVGNLVYYRYLNPAIVAPEGFDVIDQLVGPMQRKNLAEVSKMLTQIAAGQLFSEDNPYLQPLNEYVQQASARFDQWILQVIDVGDAELYFSADEFLDHTVAHRPVIYISPNEIYSMHRLVAQQIDHMAPMREDPMRVLLSELGPPPVSETQELNSARDSEITFELVSRRTSLRDPEAETKALFVETKRLVLCLLKVQSGKTLMDVFVTPVTEQDELAWEEVVAHETAVDQQRQHGRGPPMVPSMAMPARSTRLEDVRRMPFGEVKARTLENMLQLERLGKVSRENNYQDMLNAIAIDIRNKHRKRIQRHNEKIAMLTTLDNLKEKKAYLEEQINSYHSYIDQSMANMQKKGRKKFVLPFSQQYFHLRNLKSTGKVPKFGSYKYTAQKLFDKGVLLSLDNMSDRQYDQIHFTISSDEPGLFTIDASMLGINGGTVDLRIEDLLEAQFSGQSSLNLMDRACVVNLNLLIHLINKKFYA